MLDGGFFLKKFRSIHVFLVFSVSIQLGHDRLFLGALYVYKTWYLHVSIKDSYL